MEALKIAQAEVNLIIAERRVLEALLKNIPNKADRNFKLGEKIIVH